MLLSLTEYLARFYSGFHVFQYLTLRGILAAVTALALALFIGPAMISLLSRYQIGQQVRTDGPKSHLQKSGTPTMGGGLILVAIGPGHAAMGRPVQPLRVDLAGHHRGLRLDRLLRRLLEAGGGQFEGPAGALQVPGAIDRRIGDRHADAASPAPDSPAETSLYVPFFKTVAVPMSTAGFVALSYFVIVGTSNAVNLTDGLDGLAIMPAVMVAAALGVFAYVTGNFKFATYLQIPYIPGVGEALIFSATLVGAGLGFLWFNSYPAQVFMGDVGALAIGASLGTLAVIVRQEIVLFVMGGRIRARDRVGDPAGGVLQAHGKAHIPHGADTSSF